MDAAGGHVAALTHQRPAVGALAVARDGRLAFSDGSSIWTANTNGGSLQRLAYGSNPSWSPDGRRIAFGRMTDSTADRHAGAWIVNAGGGGVREIAVAAGVIETPRVAWSPDGKELAYATDAAIVVVDLASGRKWGLAFVPVGDLAWSPDGRTIAYYDEHVGDVFVVSLSGRRPVRITRSPDFDEESLAWLPDGELTFIQVGFSTDTAFAVRADGSGMRRLFRVPYAQFSWPPRLAWLPGGREVIVSGWYGGRVVRLAADGTRRRTILAGGPATSPAWSVDGKRLSYTGPSGDVVLGPGAQQRALPVFYEQCSWMPDGASMVCGRDNIYRLRLRGPFDVTTLLEDSGIGDTTKSDPDLSPDGSRFVYDEPDARSLGIYEFAHPDKAQYLSLAGSPPGIPDTPAWSPDASQVAFASACDTASKPCTPGIFVVAAAGGAARRVVPDGKNPDWSPDGAKIVFDRTIRGNRDIWVVNADGTRLRRLTHDAAAESDPSWRP